MRTQLRLITTAALAVAVPIGLVGCGSSSKKAADTTSAATTTVAATGTTVAAGNDVIIKDFAFGPSPLTVKTGTKVTWTNNDGFAHTVFEQTGPVKFDSGHINSGKSFSFTFTKPGTYAYICGIHNSMNGKVIVTS